MLDEKPESEIKLFILIHFRDLKRELVIGDQKYFSSLKKLTKLSILYLQKIVHSSKSPIELIRTIDPL